jgi:hypothetical protein
VSLPLLAAQILGAALLDGASPKVWTWGDAVREWPLDGGPPRVLAARSTGPGGCVDSRGRLYVMERPGPSRLIRVRPQAWNPEVIENETEFDSCLPLELNGRRGVVLTHLFSQVRFYQEPRWNYEELYSIYTASQQGGLLAHDVNGDGRQDLFVGNYWLRNSGRRGVPWRLFAVNVWHEGPATARAALAWTGDALVWAETAGSRVALFRPPGDDRELWREERIPVEFDQPRAVAVGDLDSDRRAEIVAGDSRRVVALRRGASWTAETLAEGFPALRLWVHRGRVVVASADQVRVLPPRR